MKSNMLAKVNRSIHEVGFTLKKYSPEILVVAGVVGTVVSTVMACKATTKLDSVLEESKTDIDKIKDYAKENEFSEKYTEQDYKKDLAITYVKSGLNLAKLYAPAVSVGVISITAILAGHNITKKRNVALTAAYATVDRSFKQYRNRVVERFGEKIDRELKYNIREEEVEVVETDEKGNTTVKKTTRYLTDPDDISEFARYFEEYTNDESGKVIKNPNWFEGDNEYNLHFIKSVERFLNDKLRINKRVFLNEAYEALGLPKSKAGQIVGWVYDETNPNIDSYISFGLYNDQFGYSDFIYGHDNGILLDFNVDGNIWENM